MEQVLSLRIDLETKKGYLKDSTNYNSIGLNPNTFKLKGWGTISFNGNIVAGGNSSYNNPLMNIENAITEYEFDLELDVNGEVATGIYSVDYYTGSQRTIGTSSTSTDIFVSYGTFNASAWTNPENIFINISGVGGSATIFYGNVTSVTDEDGSDISFQGTVSGQQLISNNRIATLYFRTLGVSFPYTGCNKITQNIGFVYDCDTDPTGSWGVYNNTFAPAGVTLGQSTGTINWPSWTGEPTITVASLPYSNNALATGTYGGTINFSVSQILQDSPLLYVQYNTSENYEWKVTCAGSLCEMNACIESLRAAHETELLRNKVSKYQPYIDNVAIYLHEAYNYKSCAQFDKYRETLAKVKATLDASGCDCGCCDDNEYKWVAASPATSTFLDNIMSEIQFRVGTTPSRPTSTNTEDGKGLAVGAIYHSTTDDKLYKITQISGAGTITWVEYFDPNSNFISSASNGLTKIGSAPSITVKLGGSLTEDTSVSVLDYQLKFDASTGSSTFTRDYTSNPYGLTTPLNVRGENSAEYPLGNGPAIAFQTSNAGLAANMGFLGFVWENLTNSGNAQFRVFTRKDGDFDWRFLVQSDGKIKGKEYGSGNFLDNNPQYFLGVDNSGAFIQIDPDNVGATASNGLTKTNGDIKLGGTLTQNTSIIANQQSGCRFTISDDSFGSWPIPFRINDEGSDNFGIFMTYIRGTIGVATTGVYYNNIPGNDYSYNIYVYPNDFNGVDPEEGTPQFKVYGDSVAQKGKIQMTRYGKGNHINNSPQYFLGVDNNGNCVEINPANVGSNTIASNGLTKTGNEIKLGGTLTSSTTINTSTTATLVLGGLQKSIASNILALNNANEIITVDNTIPGRVYCAYVSQTGTAVPTVNYTVINTLGVNPNYGNGNTGEYTLQIPNTDLTKAFISITTGDVPQKPNGVFITFKISTQSPDTMRIYTYSVGVGKEAELLKETLIKIEFYA